MQLSPGLLVPTFVCVNAMWMFMAGVYYLGALKHVGFEKTSPVKAVLLMLVSVLALLAMKEGYPDEVNWTFLSILASGQFVGGGGAFMALTLMRNGPARAKDLPHLIAGAFMVCLGVYLAFLVSAQLQAS